MSNFLTALASHLQEQYDLRKEELTVVFPNKRAASFLRSKFQALYHEEIWLPQMLSIQEAMTQWSGYQLIDQVDMLFELIAIDTEIYGSGDHIRLFGSMAAQMAKDFDEIDQYGVEAHHLFSYVYETKKIGDWNLDGSVTPKEEQHLQFFKNLERYYDLLRQRLEQQGKGYYGMITRHLAQLDDDRLAECIGPRTVIFAGFNALTPTEQAIIDKLHRNHRAEVVWDFDRYYVDDENNTAGIFARDYLRKNLAWKPTVFSDFLLSQPIEINLVSVEGKTLQSKALQSLLQVNHENDTAVILADEGLLVPVLNSIPDDTRYTSLKVSMGYPLRQTSLTHLIKAFFTLHRKGRKVRESEWYVWPILSILDLELVQVLFDRDGLDQLSAYRAFVTEKSAFVYNHADFERCCPSPEVRQFMRLLLCDSADCPDNLLDALVALLSFIASRIQALHPDGIFLLNQVSEAGKTVNRLNTVVNRYQHYVNSLADLEMLFQLVSSNTSIKLNNDTHDGLQIMGLLEARNLDFDTFYMIGVNEGILPSESSRSSFIPYSIRKECGLPDEQAKQAVYAYHFYRLLQGARKAYFLYNANNGDPNGEPSRFLLQLQYELARRNPNVVVQKMVFTAPTEPHTQPERLIVHKTDKLMELLLQKIQTDKFQQALAPTSLSAYVKCPLLFCFRYLMKIKDNSADEDTPANVIGSVVHDTLQLLYADHCGTVLTPQRFAADINSAWETKLNEAIAQQFAQGLPDVGYNYLNRLTIHKLLENYLRFEEADIAHHELSILALETTLHATLDIDGIPCTLAGKADRIDRRDGKVRVIDYKTGLVKDTDVKVPQTLDNVADIPEKALQLLIYKYLYLKQHPEVDPATVTASLYALRQRQVCLDLKVEYAPLNDAFVATMEALLGEVLRSMMDPDTHFVQPDSGSDKPCRYCEFGDICVSSAAGASLEDGR